MSNIYEELSKYYISTTDDIYQVPTDEQESWINVDYESRKIKVYTNRPTCLRKLIKILGVPNNVDVMGGIWYIDFDDRYLINKVFTMNLFLPKKSRSKNV